uniref:Pentatricopeptide repeat-containing protein n=1 Tax=Noccaea caerulescens TaxID=107243 RepID=A0A1J3JU54_NOCCA
MQRIPFSVTGIRRFSVTSMSSSSASNTDHRILKQVLESCKAPSNSKHVLQAHAHIFKLGYGTYPSLLASTVTAYRRCNLLHTARRLLLWFLSSSPNVSNTNLIIESLMRSGEYGLAKKVLRKASDRNVITWNLMIGGYVRNVQYEEALRTLKDMLSFSDIKPNKFSFASALAACARLGDLHSAKWVHSLMIDAEVELNPILCTALVDVYAKCGDIETSKEVFYSVERNHVSVWNAMITGFATHGLAREVMRVFSEMEAEHVLPDSITFLGVLTACCHCGLVEEGREFFDVMSRRFALQPKLEHYGAMVDLLGRAGKVKEAHELVESMTVEPDLVIWRSLLSSSRTYKNSEVAETAMQSLSNSKAKSGDYVLLSNMYSSTKKWDSAEKVRELMKKEGIRKAKGKSWVEFGGLIHRFKAGDRSHVESKAIYKVLEELMKKAKCQGFVAETDLVLMDVSEEEKEENLNYHSEKLALAYGVLKSSPGSEVRIQKNIRMCSDCHNWIKSVSKLLNRVIIIRDRIRFHRFQDGLCSCRDYW